MLFHVTLTHDAAHCPGYHPDLIPVWIESYQKRDELAERLGVKLRSVLNAAPDHAIYVIGEADRPMKMAMFVAQMFPPEQAGIRMTAVEEFQDPVSFIQSLGPPPGA